MVKSYDDLRYHQYHIIFYERLFFPDINRLKKAHDIIPHITDGTGIEPGKVPVVKRLEFLDIIGNDFERVFSRKAGPLSVFLKDDILAAAPDNHMRLDADKGKAPHILSSFNAFKKKRIFLSRCFIIHRNRSLKISQQLFIYRNNVELFQVFENRIFIRIYHDLFP